MFPDRGFNTEPIYLSKIEDKDGNVLQTFEPEVKQVISEVDAYTMVRMMQGVVDYGTAGSMRWRYGINSAIGGKTGTTNDYTDGWFIGYTPQILAGSWVGCDDPFLKIKQSSGGNQMAMPEWAYFMQKVYADKSLGIDPRATFQKPAELNNNPIFADQNFAAIAKEGHGSDSADVDGNGNAADYAAPTDVPVESDFSKPVPKNVMPAAKPMGPSNYNPAKKDTSRPTGNKFKKRVANAVKPNNDY
jgi:penicillin-binding protein 1A